MSGRNDWRELVADLGDQKHCNRKCALNKTPVALNASKDLEHTAIPGRASTPGSLYFDLLVITTGVLARV